MSSFENTLERMKSLYTYGKELNESSKSNAYTLEHSAVAADGKTYGIIRECNKYYIKSALKGKETIAESYEYIGGICNKKNYEYTSYNSALKNFELKMASINEACDGNVNISTLDPFKKGEFLVEGTDRMKNEIARQRQIMYNVSMLMNEGTEIGADRKNDVVKFDGKQPEAETGKKGDECVTDKKADAKPEYAGSKTNGVDKKVTPFDENAPKCEDQLKENCDCGSESCDCEKDWGTKGMNKGRDPKQVGWDVEGQSKVNEEEEDWASKGLPSSPGVGEADSAHNNMPFDKSINEEDEFGDDEDADVEGDIDADADMDAGSDVDLGTEDDFDVDGESDFDIEGDTDDDFDFGDEDDIDAESEADFGEEMSSNDDIMAQIEELQSQIDALRAQIEGGDADMESDIETDGEDFDAEGEMDSEGFEGEDDFGGDDEFEAEGDFESEFDNVEDDEFEGDDFGGEEEPMDDDEMSMGDDALMEAKRNTMNSIIESVVNSILKEDELHAWGKHPGYQKKPMELPSTGEDKNQWGEDWNDDSVYSEQPFGTKIGDGTPFEKAVDAITKDVMKKLSESVNGGKKKVK